MWREKKEEEEGALWFPTLTIKKVAGARRHSASR